MLWNEKKIVKKFLYNIFITFCTLFRIEVWILQVSPLFTKKTHHNNTELNGLIYGL